jgi:hypothetical protein
VPAQQSIGKITEPTDLPERIRDSGFRNPAVQIAAGEFAVADH